MRCGEVHTEDTVTSSGCKLCHEVHYGIAGTVTRLHSFTFGRLSAIKNSQNGERY